jgi:radical SAM superfamily enzyme YgiQ (UPF0313 family)
MMKKKVTVAHVSLCFGDAELKVTFMPLESLYLVATLQQAGYETDFRDYQLASLHYDDPQDPETFATQYLKDSADILMVLATNDAFPVAIAGLRRYKELHPETTIILGGVAPTGVSEAIIKRFPFVDIVVRGEYKLKGESASERTFLEVLEHLGNGLENIEGVVYRDRGEVKVTSPKPRIKDMSDLPLPAYDVVDLSAYDEVNIRASWGCAFTCAYCDRHRQGKVVNRTIESIVEEIKMLRYKYGQKHVFLYDEIFPLSRHRTLEFCAKLQEEKVDVKWSCVSRIDTIDEEILAAMAKAGCQYIYYGVESGSDAVLEKVKGFHFTPAPRRLVSSDADSKQEKIGGYTAAQALETIKTSLKYMNVGAFFIYGFPFETIDDFHMTVDVIEKVQELGVYPTVYALSPHPLTQIYQDFNHQLKFDRTLWEANWPKYLSNPGSREIIADLIQSYPDVFPGFYYCDPNMMTKFQEVQRRGWESHFAD